MTIQFIFLKKESGCKYWVFRKPCVHSVHYLLADGVYSLPSAASYEVLEDAHISFTT